MIAWQSAITRGSPKRSAEARWPASTVGLLEPVERVLGQHALVTDAFDLEQFAIDLVTEVAQVGQIRHRLRDVEILRVVDRGLGAEGVLLLEVLLDVRRLVLDVQARLDAVGDHARAIAPRRRRRGLR